MVRGTVRAGRTWVVILLALTTICALSLSRGEAAESGKTKTVKVNAAIHVTELYYPSGGLQLRAPS